jgi:hypothetical protein
MGEDHKQRVDRETIELLNELRVILPGVQVLLAFLLTAPFNQRFAGLSDGQKATFFLALLSTAASTAFLIAPSTYHRIRFRAGDKEHMLHVANVLTLLGTLLLATGICSAVFLVSSLLYGARTAWLVTGVGALLFVWLWYGLALVRHVRDGGATGPDRSPDGRPEERRERARSG